MQRTFSLQSYPALCTHRRQQEKSKAILKWRKTEEKIKKIEKTIAGNSCCFYAEYENSNNNNVQFLFSLYRIHSMTTKVY